VAGGGRGGNKHDACDEQARQSFKVHFGFLDTGDMKPWFFCRIDNREEDAFKLIGRASQYVY
jgi:hypothetical protein